MNLRLASILMPCLVLLLSTAACGPAPTPKVDSVATAVAQAAADLLTGTAAAASPTPLPTFTLTPTPTETPTETPTTPPFRRPQTIIFASCGLGGPEPEYPHETNIKQGKGLELLGVGSIPGYFVVRDPYFHRPCWIRIADLKVFPGTDLTKYPVMTPGIPVLGQ